MTVDIPAGEVVRLAGHRAVPPAAEVNLIGTEGDSRSWERGAGLLPFLHRNSGVLEDLQSWQTEEDQLEDCQDQEEAIPA